MFHLIKKDKEKEKDVGKKEKKDKKDKKERMSPAELKSLEEMSIRRGFFHLNRGSSKKELRSKLEISSPIPIKVASSLDLSLTDLDAERLNSYNTLAQDVGPGDEMEGVDHNQISSSVRERAAKFEELAKYPSPSQRNNDASSVCGQKYKYFYQGSKLQILHRIHIPELVEKTFPGVDLQLPVLVAPPIPDPRELKLKRRNTGDFGFSLRRTTMLDRQSDGGVCRRVVHFAEPGADTKDRALGLVPGDRLVEINGIKVEDRSRDEIVEMIRQSGESVRLKVQPILELSELNRSWLKTSQGRNEDNFNVFALR